MKIDRIEVVVNESVDGWMGAGERLKIGREVKEPEREKLQIRRMGRANISEKEGAACKQDQSWPVIFRCAPAKSTSPKCHKKSLELRSMI